LFKVGMVELRHLRGLALIPVIGLLAVTLAT